MYTKISKLLGFLALSSSFLVFFVLPVSAVETMPIVPAMDKIGTISKLLTAGFYQFNNLEIFKSPAVDEPPANVDVIQKNEKSCVIYENGKTNQPTPCVFKGDQDNRYTVLIDKETTLLGVNQESALLSDFLAGDKINVLGWLSADSKTIRAAVVRSLANKDFHQSLSGTIKKITDDGFIMVLPNGNEVTVKTPIVEGAQLTVKGVFDKVNGIISSVLSLIIKPNIIIEEPSEKPVEPAVTSKKPSTLFKNFLKVFGL